MRKLFLGLLLVPALLAAEVAPARAESRVCVDRSSMIDALVDDYGEQLAEVHEVKGSGLLEFHVSPTDGTWTALITDNAGVSCVVASGEGVDPVTALRLDPNPEVEI